MQKFEIGDRVTCSSIKAKATIVGQVCEIELANYPSLIGVELTIDRFEDCWIICTRDSGKFAPGLLAEELEFFAPVEILGGIV